MEKIKIALTQNWQKEYLSKELKAKNNDLDFIAQSTDDEKKSWSLLEQGECDAIFVNMAKIPTQLPDNLVITAVSERFSPQYELLIKKEKQVENRLLDLAADASIFLESECVPFLLKEISSDFVFSNEKTTSDAVILPAYEIEKNDFPNEKWIRITLNPREFVPKAAQGFFAYVCNKNDVETRRFLKNLHHLDSSELTNIERSFVKLNEGKICAAYCEKDKMDNFHLWVVVIQEDKSITSARASTSTKIGLAEAAMKQILENDY
jgi:porphobilinogen deaminase